MPVRRRSIIWLLTLPVPVVVLITFLLGSLQLPAEIEENAVANAREAAVRTAGQLKTLRGYYTQNVVRKVLNNGTMRADYLHQDDADAIPLPATMIHDLSKLLSKDGTSISLYSPYPFPNRQDRLLSAFQKEAWEAIQANPDETFVRVEEREGLPVLRVALADTMTAQACVACHNSHPDTPKTGWKLGDVRGILEISTSIQPALDRGAELSSYFTLALALIGILLTIVAVLTARMIAGPLTGLAAVMISLARGDMTVRVPYTEREDEIGEMAQTVEVFKENSRKRLEAEQQVGELVKSIAGTSENIEGSINSQASGVSEQATSISQTTAALSSIRTGAQQTLADVRAMNEKAQLARGEGSAGLDSVFKCVEAMGAIRSNMADIEKTILDLGEKTQKIFKITGVVADLAHQSKMLSVNASIEAAMAGEAGKGFAVVAEEMGKLAEQSEAATIQVRAVLEEIDDASTAVATVTGEGQMRVETGSELMNVVKGGIEALDHAIEDTATLSDKIVNTISQQSSGISQVSHAMTEIRGASQSLADATLEIQAAFKGLTDRIHGLRDKEQG